ncbi:HU family DNA-binding protein [Seohaeicola saemankumensis]|uniref:HU family DNA-binding protein n=1 Tax=Seohaeicola saemankumensis TaxID=481181 RepID=UPI0035D0B5F3
MLRSELVARIAAENPKLTNADAEKIVRTIFDSITETLGEGGRVELRGFGAFTVKHREPRQGRNPRTGDSIHVVAKSHPFFKASRKLLARLNAATA